MQDTLPIPEKPTVTIEEFKERFPTEESILKFLFEKRFGDLKECPKCNKNFRYYRVKKRKSYECGYCGHHLHPTADTIMHKSDTDLRKWFEALFLYTATEDKITAKELQRRLQVTYKTAWRIRSLFRKHIPYA